MGKDRKKLETARDEYLLNCRIQGKSEKTTEQDYAITWILPGISSSELRHRLAFKGGTALRKIYFPQYRYSENLDFTIVQASDEELLVGSLESVLNGLEKSVAFVFDLDRGRVERRTDSRTPYGQCTNVVGVTGFEPPHAPPACARARGDPKRCASSNAWCDGVLTWWALLDLNQ